MKMRSLANNLLSDEKNFDDDDEQDDDEEDQISKKKTVNGLVLARKKKKVKKVVKKKKLSKHQALRLAEQAIHQNSHMARPCAEAHTAVLCGAAPHYSNCFYNYIHGGCESKTPPKPSPAPKSVKKQQPQP